MTILITGATGNVGSRLLIRLAASGMDCRALVRTGKRAPEGVTVINGDVLEPESLTTAVDGVTTIVHLAAVLRSRDSDEIWRVNLEGTRNLISAALAHAPTARFVMASTSLVYPEHLPRPGREDDLLSPAAAYPASKVAAEQALISSGLTWSVLRLGFVYGDGDHHLESAPRLFSRWHWHPAHALHLLHQRDVATAVELAITGATDGHIVNVVDEAPITAYEIADLVGAQLNPSAEPLDNPWAGRLDGSLARRLGFTPEIPTVFHAVREATL